MKCLLPLIFLFLAASANAANLGEVTIGNVQKQGFDNETEAHSWCSGSLNWQKTVSSWGHSSASTWAANGYVGYGQCLTGGNYAFKNWEQFTSTYPADPGYYVETAIDGSSWFVARHESFIPAIPSCSSSHQINFSAGYDSSRSLSVRGKVLDEYWYIGGCSSSDRSPFSGAKRVAVEPSLFESSSETPESTCTAQGKYWHNSECHDLHPTCLTLGAGDTFYNLTGSGNPAPSLSCKQFTAPSIQCQAELVPNAEVQVENVWSGFYSLNGHLCTSNDSVAEETSCGDTTKYIYQDDVDGTPPAVIYDATCAYYYDGEQGTNSENQCTKYAYIGGENSEGFITPQIDTFQACDYITNNSLNCPDGTVGSVDQCVLAEPIQAKGTQAYYGLQNLNPGDAWDIANQTVYSGTLHYSTVYHFWGNGTVESVPALTGASIDQILTYIQTEMTSGSMTIGNQTGILEHVANNGDKHYYNWALDGFEVSYFNNLFDVNAVYEVHDIVNHVDGTWSLSKSHAITSHEVLKLHGTQVTEGEPDPDPDPGNGSGSGGNCDPDVNLCPEHLEQQTEDLKTHSSAETDRVLNAFDITPVAHGSFDSTAAVDELNAAQAEFQAAFDQISLDIQTQFSPTLVGSEVNHDHLINIKGREANIGISKWFPELEALGFKHIVTFFFACLVLIILFKPSKG